MNDKAAQPALPLREAADPESVQSRIKALELELEQKNVLLEQGFAAFTEAAEKLQDSHKILQKRIAELNLELEEKNRELERNLAERDKVKTYLSNIFESLPVGVFVMDLDGNVTSVNQAALDMIGARADSLAGRHVNEVMAQTLVEQNPDGACRLAEGQGEDEPVTFHRADGDLLRLEVSFTAMRGEGRTLGYILNLQDVTLLKRLEEQAERRNRFTAMGEMAANIAHEIRNPLGSIELFASLVKKGLAGNQEQMVLMNHISSGISGMNHIISNVLEYTKPRPVHLKNLDLPRLLREIGEFTSYMAEQNGVEVAFDLPSAAARVRGDEELLRQVFHNLMLNAVQAMTEGGTVTVSARPITLTQPRQLARFEHLEPAGRKALEVLEVGFQDTGPGITREVRKQIFDPFFTTKSRGTGLGLAIVHNIIEAHHGTIDVESRRNKGARFVFMFPIIPTLAKPPRE